MQEFATQAVQVLKQDYHRNGVGGAGFVVSLFEWNPESDEYDTFVGISFDIDVSKNDRNRRDSFTTHTAVLRLDELLKGNIEFGRGNSWRGADHVGPYLADAWAASDPEFFLEDEEFEEL